MSLPTDAATRKTYPIFRGLFKYFPDALAEVSHVSFVANEQHNPGQELHWSKGKSADHYDALLRHMLDSIAMGPFDTDGLRHKAKAAWRALADLQTEIEDEREANAVEEDAREQAFANWRAQMQASVNAGPKVSTSYRYTLDSAPPSDYSGVVESYESYLDALGEKADSRLQGRD